MNNKERDFISSFEFSKQLGQNFLIDKKVIERILNVIRSITFCNEILEIGPGVGAITKLLCEQYKVKAIELDHKLVKYLDKLNLANLTVIENDALEVNWQELISNDGLIYSNTPYCITTALINKYILSNISCKVIFLMQKEVYERISAEINSKHYSAYSVYAQTFIDINKLFDVDKSAFVPQPKVVSTLCSITKKEYKVQDLKKYWKFLTLCFGMRRKTLINNLKFFLDDNKIQKIFNVLGISNKMVRAQELSVEQYLMAFAVYNNEI